MVNLLLHMEVSFSFYPILNKNRDTAVRQNRGSLFHNFSHSSEQSFQPAPVRKQEKFSHSGKQSRFPSYKKHFPARQTAPAQKD